MQLSTYVEHFRRDLLAAAEAGGDEARQAAERLSYAIDPSARLALMEAISQAAAEITAEMREGSVEVRLAGRDVEFVVEQTPVLPTPPTPPAPPEPPLPPALDAESDDAQARITVRLPESIKARAEERAAAAGQSLNTWLVSAIREATADAATRPMDVTSFTVPGEDPFAHVRRGSRRMTGWI